MYGHRRGLPARRSERLLVISHLLEADALNESYGRGKPDRTRDIGRSARSPDGKANLD